MNGAMMAMENGTGLRLVPKPVQRAVCQEELREGSTGRTVMLPRVWAVAETGPVLVENAVPQSAAVAAVEAPPVELAFYRKYTEALLRRYLRLSMQAGRVPSMLNRDVFRGQVTRYSVRGFEDTVIFCHDVEQRLARLNPGEQQIIKRIVLQRYNQGETAGMLGISLRNCLTRYALAIDRLTGLLLEAKLLEPLKR